tara:strand:+ start:3385 stop:3735 length:351 start_codon:yes stop_codon:yes gene_type:complete
MSTFYISTDTQYPSGLMGVDSSGAPIVVGGRFDHLYEIETHDDQSIIAKAMNAGCHVRSCPETVTVSFGIGDSSGTAFAKTLGARLPARSRVRLHVDDKRVEYVFSRAYALGARVR